MSFPINRLRGEGPHMGLSEGGRAMRALGSVSPEQWRQPLQGAWWKLAGERFPAHSLIPSLVISELA